MKTFLIAGRNSLLTVVSACLLWFACMPLTAQTAESNLEKAFDVKPGGLLVMDVEQGSITIDTGESSVLKVFVKRSVRGMKEAEAKGIFDAHEVIFSQDGDRVEVRAKYTAPQAGQPRKKLRNAFRQMFSDRQHLQVEYLIQAPRQYRFDLRTSAGEISAGDIEGEIKMRTAGGNIKLKTVQGPVEAVTSAGEIHLASASGPAKLKTSGGDIRLGRVEAETIAETSAGSIKVQAAKAQLTVKTSGGDIDLGEVTGQTKADTSAGNIHVKLAHAPLAVHTSGGNIHVEAARDTVAAKTSAGSVTVCFLSQPHEDCSLITSGGNVVAKVSENLKFDVDAHTSGGNVRTELPITMTVVGQHKIDVLRGKLNGGGQALVMKTSAGDVRIERLNATPELEDTQ
ncbi:MAG TPA: DUF4097 family beta strand repeat-containing protein [Clostridia bacterium]|nr:DUF4097 family beta strand repeat-containing protein [Clostridia bacterium]